MGLVFTKSNLAAAPRVRVAGAGILGKNQVKSNQSVILEPAYAYVLSLDLSNVMQETISAIKSLLSLVVWS